MPGQPHEHLDSSAAMMALAIVAVLALAVAAGPVAVAPARAEARPQGDACAAIQQAIDALPSGGGRLVLAAQTYACSAPVVIDRDNVELVGQGAATVLRLADGVDAPVLILGQARTPPTEVRGQLRVADLLVDGNRANQQFECGGGDCATNPLRNNAITLRNVQNVRIERVSVVGARSGGLVSEYGTRRLLVRDFTASDSHFDGLAAYQTEDSVFDGMHLYDNGAAGLSFDLGFNHNIVTNASITGSGTVGVFMRDSRYNIFQGVQVRRSRDHGIFLAQADGDASTPAAGNTFAGVVVADSGGAGIRVNDASSVDNLVTGSQVFGTADRCFSEVAGGLLQVHATRCR
jgi:hypothetical protein